jgi:hypothetical protein
MMPRARRILSGGWLGRALSVFTRGWYYGPAQPSLANYVVEADIECRFLGVDGVDLRVLGIADGGLTAAFAACEMRTAAGAASSLRTMTAAVGVEL